jgi:hypothetical protein
MGESKQHTYRDFLLSAAFNPPSAPVLSRRERRPAAPISQLDRCGRCGRKNRQSFRRQTERPWVAAASRAQGPRCHIPIQFAEIAMLGIPKLTEKLAERDTGVECTTHRHVEGACGSLASGRVTYRDAPPSALAWQRMFRMRRGQTHVRHIKLSTSYRIHTNSLRFDDAPASALLVARFDQFERIS